MEEKNNNLTNQTFFAKTWANNKPLSIVLIVLLVTCCGLPGIAGLTVGVYELIYGTPPDRTTVERIEELERLTVTDFKPFTQGEFEKLVVFRENALKIEDDNSYASEYRNLAIRVEKLLKKEIDWFKELSQKSVDTLNVEQIEQLNGFEERYSVFKAEDSIAKYAAPVADAIHAKTPALKFRGIAQQARSLMGDIDESDFEALESKQKLIEKVAQNLNEISNDKEFRGEAQELLRSVETKIARIEALKLAGPKPKFGGQIEIKDYLRRTLNDYDSSEFLGWSEPVLVDIGDQPLWVVRLELRAKNMFGAYIRRTAVFFIAQDKIVNVEGL